MFIVILVALACASTDVQQVGTTLTVPFDSEWQVPPEFGVTIPFTQDRARELIENDRGGPPDTPEFSMWGEVVSHGELAQVTIALFSDGVSDEARPAETLRSWFGSFDSADFTEPVRLDRNGLHIAISRGQARHASQSSPQGADLTVFLEPETQRVWRLLCLASIEVVDNEVARICEQVRDGFRPLKNPYARQ